MTPRLPRSSSTLASQCVPGRVWAFGEEQVAVRVRVARLGLRRQQDAVVRGAVAHPVARVGRRSRNRSGEVPELSPDFLVADGAVGPGRLDPHVLTRLDDAVRVGRARRRDVHQQAVGREVRRFRMTGRRAAVAVVRVVVVAALEPLQGSVAARGRRRRPRIPRIRERRRVHRDPVVLGVVAVVALVEVVGRIADVDPALNGVAGNDADALVVRRPHAGGAARVGPPGDAVVRLGAFPADLASERREDGGHRQVGRQAEDRLGVGGREEDRHLVGLVGNGIGERERARRRAGRVEGQDAVAVDLVLEVSPGLHHDVLRGRVGGASREDLLDVDVVEKREGRLRLQGDEQESERKDGFESHRGSLSPGHGTRHIRTMSRSRSPGLVNLASIVARAGAGEPGR